LEKLEISQGIKNTEYQFLLVIENYENSSYSFFSDQAVAYKDIGNIEQTFKGLKSLKEINLDFSM